MGILKDSVSPSVQKDAQKFLDAFNDKNIETLNKIMAKYSKDAGRDQGGGGAGPGKVKQARPGTAQLYWLAREARDKISKKPEEKTKSRSEALKGNQNAKKAVVVKKGDKTPTYAKKISFEYR